MSTEPDFAAIVRHAYDGVNVVDIGGRFLAVNDAYCDMSGYAEEELLGMHLWDVDAVFDREGVLANLAGLRPEARVRFETVHRHKDGSLYEVEASVKRLPGDEWRAVAFIRDLRVTGEGAGSLATGRDFLMKLASISRALLESEARLREMADTIEDVFWTIDAESGQVLFVSAAVERVWGLPAEGLLDGSVNWLEGILPEDRPALQEAWAKCRAGEAATCEVRVRHPDGRVRWLLDRGYPRRDDDGRISVICGCATDITEQRSAEARALQSQKMEAVGHLAGGVAHDFNNLLLLISGYCDCLVEDGISSPFLDMVKEIRAAARRAGELTKQLLAFSNHRYGKPLPLDLDAAVARALHMLRRIVRENVLLEYVGPDAPLTVLADRALLDQVLLNLAVNARDAMADGGQLRIEVTSAQVRGTSWALLRVIDSGIGLSADELPHIFEPFFTTKRSGKGTGLGLATVYGIVEQHGGWIDVESTPGEGTEFRVYLPLSDLPAAVDTEEPAPLAAGGGERVLLVEDEEAVRKVLYLLLSRLGYRVTAAADGRQGIERWREHEGNFDIVVTDIVMPGLSGHELGRQLQAERPHLPVLYVSGYNPEQDTCTLPADNFLCKPCSQDELDHKIRGLLEAAASQR